MKKNMTILLLLSLPIMTFSQDIADKPRSQPLVNGDVLRMGLLVAFTYLVIALFLHFIEAILQAQVKRKLIETQTPSDLATSILQSGVRDLRKTALQWFCVLLCIGIGLIIINALSLYGYSSLIVLCFSGAAGFLVYYLFSKRLQ